MKKRKEVCYGNSIWDFALMDRLFPLMFLVVFIFIISTIVGSLVSGAKRKHKMTSLRA